MAKKHGVAGWHSMRKEQLIRVLIQVARKKARNSSSVPAAPPEHAGHPSPNKPKSSTDPRVLEKIRQDHHQREMFRDLAANSNPSGRRSGQRDRVVLLVRDPYWLHIYWEITRHSVQRAHVALADCWHDAQPTLRILSLDGDGVSNALENVYRDVGIHGGVNNWYVDVANPPGSFRAVLGYKLSDGRFHPIAKSNTVTTPLPSGNGGLDAHWAEIAKDYERIYTRSGGNQLDANPSDLREVFEEKLRRPMVEPMFARFGGALSFDREGLPFDVEVEMVVFGMTDPKASVNIGGEPVKVRPDGSFAVSFTMPDRRQVIPVVASSRDGARQRTTVLAIERNTKVMEPINSESDEL
jgi:hypothetical protein